MKKLPAQWSISKQGIDFIKKWEKFSPQMYYCQAGKPTIGYGHVITEKEQHLMTATITEAEAIKLLGSDLAIAEVRMRRLWKVAMTQNMYDMLVSLVFNVGSPKPHQGIVTKINAGESKLHVLVSLHAWNKVRNKKNELIPSNGLTRRRKEEGVIMFS